MEMNTLPRENVEFSLIIIINGLQFIRKQEDPNPNVSSLPPPSAVGQSCRVVDVQGGPVLTRRTFPDASLPLPCLPHPNVVPEWRKRRPCPLTPIRACAQEYIFEDPRAHPWSSRDKVSAWSTSTGLALRPASCESNPAFFSSVLQLLHAHCPYTLLESVWRCALPSTDV